MSSSANLLVVPARNLEADELHCQADHIYKLKATEVLACLLQGQLIKRFPELPVAPLGRSRMAVGTGA